MKIKKKKAIKFLLTDHWVKDPKDNDGNTLKWKQWLHMVELVKVKKPIDKPPQ